MRTVKIDGVWNLIDGRGCLVRRGTFAEIIECMRGMW